MADTKWLEICHLLASEWGGPLALDDWTGFLELSNRHWWFSGRILACHAGDPGSIPG